MDASDDRQPVKLSLPPLPLHGLPEPLRVTIDFEADMVEEMLARLTLLYRSPLRNGSREGRYGLVTSPG